MRLRRWIPALVITLMLIDGWLPEAAARTSRVDSWPITRPAATPA
jgi:hypothetical protein